MGIGLVPVVLEPFINLSGGGVVSCRSLDGVVSACPLSVGCGEAPFWLRLTYTRHTRGLTAGATLLLGGVRGCMRGAVLEFRSGHSQVLLEEPIMRFELDSML